MVLFCYHKKSIRVKNKIEHNGKKIKESQKIRHFDLSVILKFKKKKLFYKICIFSQKIHQHYFILKKSRKSFRRHLEFGCHFEFLFLASFFSAQNL
jgi:hypothetical protein